MYEALRSSGLQVAVLADHNRVDVAQALVARSRDEGIPIDLVVGEEITTRGGHLVGIGLASVVPAGLSLAEAVAAVHEQGGIAVVAHPAAARPAGRVRAPARRPGRGRSPLSPRRPRGDASGGCVGAGLARTGGTAGAALRLCRRRRVRRPRRSLGRARPDRLPRRDDGRAVCRDPRARDVDRGTTDPGAGPVRQAFDDSVTASLSDQADHPGERGKDHRGVARGVRQGRDGKRASPKIQPAVVRAAHVDDDLITFVLTDGREVSAPTAWSRPLSAASQEQRDQFEIEPAGLIVERPALDRSTSACGRRSVSPRRTPWRRSASPPPSSPAPDG